MAYPIDIQNLIFNIFLDHIGLKKIYRSNSFYQKVNELEKLNLIKKTKKNNGHASTYEITFNGILLGLLLCDQKGIKVNRYVIIIKK